MVFSYFGTKSRIIHLYPQPRFHYIVEPFCGAAYYAVRWGLDRGVWINDKYEVVYRCWKLMQEMTLSDVEALPHDLELGADLRDLALGEEQRLLMGFAVSLGQASPCHRVSSRALGMDKDGRGDNKILLFKNRLRRIVGKIDHWKITNLDFRRVRTKFPSTYFVDPPYQTRRKDYAVRNGRNFYRQCASYCRRVLGQVIVCEMEGATWLPEFRVFVQQNNVVRNRADIPSDEAGRTELIAELDNLGGQGGRFVWVAEQAEALKNEEMLNT